MVIAQHHIKHAVFEHLARIGKLAGLHHGAHAQILQHPTQNAARCGVGVDDQRLAVVHVGGKSALDWHGLRQYVARQPVLQLYGWTAGRLPAWFIDRFPAEYHRKRLFDERPELLLHVGPFEQRSGAPRVSAPERALLELLSEVGVRQTLQEARELVESTYSLRADVLQELLKRCTSVKTVRLCLLLGGEGSLPWMRKLDPATLPKGSDRAWVARSANGLLVLKP